MNQSVCRGVYVDYSAACGSGVSLAMVVSVALAVELTKDTWLDHMPTNFASLLGAR